MSPELFRHVKPVTLREPGSVPRRYTYRVCATMIDGSEVYSELYNCYMIARLTYWNCECYLHADRGCFSNFTLYRWTHTVH